jgi:hypothetical protein
LSQRADPHMDGCFEDKAWESSHSSSQGNNEQKSKCFAQSKHSKQIWKYFFSTLNEFTKQLVVIGWTQFVFE